MAKRKIVAEAKLASGRKCTIERVKIRVEGERKKRTLFYVRTYDMVGEIVSHLEVQCLFFGHAWQHWLEAVAELPKFGDTESELEQRRIRYFKNLNREND